MEHKEVGIRAQFRHDEGDPLLHEPADEVHVTAEPIERITSGLTRRLRSYQTEPRLGWFGANTIPVV